MIRTFSILLICFAISFSSCKKESCSDGLKNQNETGVDCGGECDLCPTCSDAIMNQGETGIDCGGPCTVCGTCSDGIKNQGEAGIDCGGPCTACVTASCTDGIKNQGETGIDCGGPCSACATCSDGIQNQGETGVDCGGPCSACPPVDGPCTLSENTSDYPSGFQDDSYMTSCAINNFSEYQMTANGSYSDIDVFFSSIPTSNKIYKTSNNSPLGENEVKVTSVFGGTFSYYYLATSDQDVYVNVSGGIVTVEFCGMIFSSPSGGLSSVPVSAYLKCN